MEVLMKLNFVTLAAVTVVAVFFGARALDFPWTHPRIMGMAIAVPAFLLFALARIQLGRSFSVQAKATKLVTTGLYSRIRNPIYFFGGMMIAGIIIWAGKPWFLIFFAVLIPLQVIRSRKESQVLEAEFGDAYREYKKKTWF